MICLIVLCCSNEVSTTTQKLVNVSGTAVSFQKHFLPCSKLQSCAIEFGRCRSLFFLHMRRNNCGYIIQSLLVASPKKVWTINICRHICPGPGVVQYAYLLWRPRYTVYSVHPRQKDLLNMAQGHSNCETLFETEKVFFAILSLLLF